MASKHVHKYHHIDMSYGTKLWACALPTCNHHMPKHIENSLIGKFSICWNCAKNFILDTENMKLDKPICYDCANPKTEVLLDLADKFEHSTDENEKDSLSKRLMDVLTKD